MDSTMATKYLQPDDMFELLRQSYDDRYYNHVYGLASYMLGERYSANAVGALAPLGEFPDYPLIFPRRLKVGESRRILSNQVLTLMKVAYMTPELEFPDVDELTEKVRQAIAREFWTSEDYYDGAEWSHECHDTFMDGDAFGMGWTRVGVDDGQVTIQHHRLVDVIWSRLASNPARSPFIGWIHHMPVDKAVDLFGSKVKGEQTIFGGMERGVETKLERVKIIEWRDTGIGKHEPTCIYFLNQIGGKILHVGPNDFECINGAYYSHVKIPEQERPIGRVDMQLGSQEFRNALERLMKLTLQRGSGFDAGDASSIEPSDLARMIAGQQLPFVRLNLKEGQNAANIINRTPPQGIGQDVFALLQYVDRELATESGNSDADRANLSLDKRTLGENVLAKEGAEIQTAWSSRQYAAYQQRLWHKVFKIASKFHTKPIQIKDSKGRPYLLNNPADPRSALSVWLAEKSRVNASEEQYQDASVKAAQFFKTWQPFMGDRFTNQIELRKKMFAGMGQKDVDPLIDPTGNGGLGPQPMVDPAQMQVGA